MRTVRFLMVGVFALSIFTVCSAQQLRNREYGRSRLDDRAKMRDNKWTKRGQTKPGRYGRWSRSDEGDLAGDWSSDEGWLAPPDTMSEEDFQSYEADVRSPAGDIQTGAVPPINWNGVTYVACRDYFNAVGTVAYWNAPIGSAQAKLNDGRSITLPLTQGVVKIDGKQVALAHPTIAVNDIMMVPLRDLSIALGFTVQWDPDRQTSYLVPTTVPAAESPATP